MVNTNCLEGIRCPICGNEKAFYIQSTAVMHVTDDGAECRSDIEWDDDSHTQCPRCERSGKLVEFRTAQPRQYIVASSHGKLAIDVDGYVLDCDAHNDDADGRHLKSITRFDLVEWRKHWGNPDTDSFDILDLGYLYTDRKTAETAYAPPDAQWRKQIADTLLQRKQTADEGEAA